MKTYRCVRTFVSSHSGHTYYFGRTITETEYKGIPINQQRNFTPVNDPAQFAEKAEMPKKLYR